MSATNIFKSLAKILSAALGGGGGGGGSGQGNDADEYFTNMLKMTNEVESSFGPDQHFERAVSSILKDSLGVVAGLKGDTTRERIKGMDQALDAKMPEIIKASGIEDLVSDYMLKSPGAMDQKLNSVVSAFSGKSMELGGLASVISEKMQTYLKDAVPETPAQKSGLAPSFDEISQSIDNAPKQPKMSYDNGPRI